MFAFILSILLSEVCGQSILEVPKASNEETYKNTSLYEIRVVEKELVRINVTSAASLPLQLSIDDPSVAQTLNGSVTENHFILQGLFVGRTKLRIVQANGTTVNYTVAVLRGADKAQKIFGAIVSVFSITTSFMMGTQIDWRIILATLKKPIAPIIGLVCQFGIMPLVALGWGRVLLPGKEFLQLGYFAVGCCPGGKMSNMFSILLDANLDLSATLTACSTILALGMMPAWLLTVAPNVISQEADIHIPYPDLMKGLALFIVPTIIGIVLKHFKPAWADAVGSKVKIASTVTILIIVTAAGIINYYIFLLFTWQAVLAGMLLPWTGFMLSWCAAWALRQSPRDVRTIAIETGIQNASIATIVILFSLPQPDSDLTLVMPVVCMMFTPIPLLIAVLFLMGKKRWDARKANEEVNEGTPVKTTVVTNSTVFPMDSLGTTEISISEKSQ